VDVSNGVLTLYGPAGNVRWQQLDAGSPGKLAGAWVITGRIRDGKMSNMNPGARRTMKILSGTRFQWIAYNVETHEFFATGGGTYTTKDGKYTENIEFFSRDDSRVGASLTFDYAIEGGNWRHRGLSSKGEPVDEVWTEREKTGL
ncbi:MAG TPA: membrane or secreted protein, partial [Chryseosolibacter sp.]